MEQTNKSNDTTRSNQSNSECGTVYRSRDLVFFKRSKAQKIGAEFCVRVNKRIKRNMLIQLVSLV